MTKIDNMNTTEIREEIASITGTLPKDTKRNRVISRLEALRKEKIPSKISRTSKPKTTVKGSKKKELAGPTVKVTQGRRGRPCRVVGNPSSKISVPIIGDNKKGFLYRNFEKGCGDFNGLAETLKNTFPPRKNAIISSLQEYRQQVVVYYNRWEIETGKRTRKSRNKN